ncbi:hypothetical protein Glove_84g25 [Diversispora epigaea]|uniref:Uncharacterized protein n=1 Tax=Diversispora epigaea TaxID=1348612 RepID=A0A397JEB1_9GLOM|nr:hypothetical protein Glove_84g25 [Diversispora epigaea]
MADACSVELENGIKWVGKKINALTTILQCLLNLNENDLVHHLDSCKFENDLILNSNNKHNIIYSFAQDTYNRSKGQKISVDNIVMQQLKIADENQSKNYLNESNDA